MPSLSRHLCRSLWLYPGSGLWELPGCETYWTASASASVESDSIKMLVSSLSKASFRPWNIAQSWALETEHVPSFTIKPSTYFPLWYPMRPPQSAKLLSLHTAPSTLILYQCTLARMLPVGKHWQHHEGQKLFSYYKF